MQIHQIYRQQNLKMSPQAAWDFFSSPHNLNDITPDFFNVKITSQVPAKIYAGLMISYQMTAVFGLPMAWLSEVSYCDEPRRFVYQQAIGPFKFFSHEVSITETASGVVMADTVFYAMRWGWLGDLLHAALIGEKLQRIFDTRQQRLQDKWG